MTLNDQQATSPITTAQRDIRQILTRLNDDNPFVRRAVLDDLMRIGEEAVPGLLVVLHTREPNVREAAAWALGELGYAKAVPGLLAALAVEESPLVRDSIVWALEMLDDMRAVPDLLEALTDAGESARDSIAAALGHLDSVQCVEGLLEAITTSEGDTRQAAAWALAQILVEPPSKEEFYQISRALSAHLSDQDGKVRWVCTRGMYEASLGYAGMLKSAVHPLIGRLDDTFPSPWGDPERVCDIAALTLDNIDTPRARTALQEWYSG